MPTKFQQPAFLINDGAGAIGYKNPVSGADLFLPVVFAQSGAAVSVTGTLVETTLARVVIPGGLMGVNGSLRILPVFSVTNSANNKTLKVYLGATAFLNALITTNSVEAPYMQIRNRGAQNSQFGFPAAGNTGLGTAGAAITTGNIDTSVDQVLTITGQLASAGETITLEGFTVEVLPTFT